MSQSIVVALPAQVDLAPAPIPADWILAAKPEARSKQLVRSRDGASSIMAWSCTAGRFNWRYTVDETVHIISGGDDGDQHKDGDFLAHDERYARTDEYVEILRRIWTADKAIDHQGKYYTFTRSFSDVKPLQKPHLPIYFGGSSDAAIAIAGA